MKIPLNTFLFRKFQQKSFSHSANHTILPNDHKIVSIDQYDTLQVCLLDNLWIQK